MTLMGFFSNLIDQSRAEGVTEFFRRTPSEELFITDFALNSVGIVMSRLKRMDAFLVFVRDAFLERAVAVIRLLPEDMQQLVQVTQRYNLDFDDAYQCVAAEKYGLTLVSLDSDFDRTERGRKTPAEATAG